MKHGILLGIATAMALFVFAGGPVSAGQSGGTTTLKRSITLIQDAVVGGKTLEHGKYDAEITGADDATLVIKRDKQEIARVKVRRSDLATPAKYDRVDVRSAESGKEVVAVQFKGERSAFEVVDDQGVALIEKP
jgi:hypothetical protein